MEAILDPEIQDEEPIDIKAEGITTHEEEEDAETKEYSEEDYPVEDEKKKIDIDSLLGDDEPEEVVSS